MNALPISIRACAHCEREQGILDRSDVRKSHGHCRRHFIDLLLKDGMTLQQIEIEISHFSQNAFCPDLGAPLERAA